MSLVQHLRGGVFDWLSHNSTNPRVKPHMEPLPHWPEYPNGKVWDSLRLVDPEDRVGFEEWMIGLHRSKEHEPACVQAYEVIRHACAQLLWEKQKALGTLPESYRIFCADRPQ
jgi:hypothetical protein